MVDESLYAYKRSQLELTRSDFHRYLYDDINWNARMVALQEHEASANQPWSCNI